VRQITGPRAISLVLRRREIMNNVYSRLFSFIGVLIILFMFYSFLFLRNGFLFLVLFVLFFVVYFIFSFLLANEISGAVRSAGYVELEKGGIWKVPVYQKKIDSVSIKLRSGLVSSGRSTAQIYEISTNNPDGRSFTLRSNESSNLQASIFKFQDNLENASPLPQDLAFIKQLPELAGLSGRWKLSATSDSISLTMLKSVYLPLDIPYLLKSEEDAILAVYRKLSK